MRNQVERKIGFVGAGQMARALAGGFVKNKIVPSDLILASDANKVAVADFCEQIAGSRGISSNAELVAAADVIFLAVKPQHVEAVFSELTAATSEPVSKKKLFVSIVAGLTCLRMIERLGTDRIVRVMPNTPCLIGQGMSAYAVGSGASAEDTKLVQDLFQSVGDVVAVEEQQLDAVTGLSGSGPAFVFQSIEAMIDGGVQVGLEPELARTLVVQTVIGAAMMVRETGETPAVLTDRVASPNGTTEAGLKVLSAKKFKLAIRAAVDAAARRSRELGAE